jgi:hypothetical protein
MIPRTYEQWCHCIEHDCGIRLTPDFVEWRIRELSDNGNRDTLRFIQLYGDGHHQLTLRWLTTYF